MKYEWFVFIHERGHMVYSSMYNLGSTQSYTHCEPKGNNTWITVHEIHRKEVSYLNDPRTPCLSKPREEEMDTCIQHFIEAKMGCQLPWHTVASNLSKCTEPEQYEDFMVAYDEIVSLSGFSIAKKTGCLPSCKINEFTVNVVSHITHPDEEAKYQGYFFYPGGRYQQKVYFYTYDFTSYIADAGGLVGLFLGFSILNVYDGLKYIWKNKRM